jgi:4-hydroxybenzoyl-CoA thioesterase
MPRIQWVRKYDIVGIPLVDAYAKFNILSYYGDDIVIESQITVWCRTSFNVAHRVLKVRALVAEGFETRVWLERDPTKPGSIRSKVITNDVIASFERV